MNTEPSDLENSLKSFAYKMDHPFCTSEAQFMRHASSAFRLWLGAAALLFVPILLFCAITRHYPAPGWLAIPCVIGTGVLLCLCAIQFVRTILDFTLFYRLTLAGCASAAILVALAFISAGILPAPWQSRTHEPKLSIGTEPVATCIDLLGPSPTAIMAPSTAKNVTPSEDAVQ